MSTTPALHPPRFSAKTVGLLAAVVTVLIWTSFIVIARASADPARSPTLAPFDIVYARLWGAAIFLLPWGWWLTRRDLARQREAGQVAQAGSFFGMSPLPLRLTVQVGFFGGLLYAMLAYWGFVFAPAAHASVLMPGSLPLWTALLAILLLGTPVTAARAVGLACIVGGDLLVGGASLLHAFDGSGVWRGDLFFIAASMTWATYSVLTRLHALDAVRATIAITAFGFFTFVPVYTVLTLAGWVQGHIWTAPVHDVVFQMFFQGVGSVVISGITFTKMIQYYGPVRSTMITALVPGLSALAAVVFLGEPLHWNLLAGLALVTVGILFGVHKTKPAHTATENIADPAQKTGAGA
ncbi:MAG: DMT family transporter [Rhodoferax sp.]|nr:DMT family transporter [Rhodoferax sp.]